MLGNLNEAKNLKRLEITGSTVVTAGNVIGAMGSRASVDEIVIHGSSLSPAEGADHYYAIGGGEYASFGSIDIQGSQINIPLASKGAVKVPSASQIARCPPLPAPDSAPRLVPETPLRVLDH